jgi:hypothetical protein
MYLLCLFVTVTNFHFQSEVQPFEAEAHLLNI